VPALALLPNRELAGPQVEEICERVDRVPLAIELAAMHVGCFWAAGRWRRPRPFVRKTGDGVAALRARAQTPLPANEQEAFDGTVSGARLAPT
jgi:hypothetical protein